MGHIYNEDMLDEGTNHIPDRMKEHSARFNVSLRGTHNLTLHNYLGIGV